MNGPKLLHVFIVCQHIAEQVPFAHLASCHAGNGSSIWGPASGSLAAWPSSGAPVGTPHQSIWADASSPYTSAPLPGPSQGSSPALSRLHSLWGAPADPGLSASAAQGLGDGGWQAAQPRNGLSLSQLFGEHGSERLLANGHALHHATASS